MYTMHNLNYSYVHIIIIANLWKRLWATVRGNWLSTESAIRSGCTSRSNTDIILKCTTSGHYLQEHNVIFSVFVCEHCCRLLVSDTLSYKSYASIYIDIKLYRHHKVKRDNLLTWNRNGLSERLYFCFNSSYLS